MSPTVDLLAGLDDLAKGHLLLTGLLEAREDTGTELELLVEILLGPAVVLDGKLGRHGRIEVGLVDTERVEVGDVVSTDLESTDEELDLVTYIQSEL
jgi:hypothetical protein